MWREDLEGSLSGEYYYLWYNQTLFHISYVSFQLCGGIRQSPINIDFASTSATAQHPSGGALTFSGYDQVRVGVWANTVEHIASCQDCKAVTDNDLKNNGHTAVSYHKLKRRRRRW